MIYVQSTKKKCCDQYGLLSNSRGLSRGRSDEVQNKGLKEEVHEEKAHGHP